ncbi:protein APEM9 [Humulus lupulus]|uniref:protein APEM9 n=1 Tax=Humulus lupulus TaxID=3486 RepID=UPI002B407879|nr:protein APEM9 [Humulus lupulus]XP_062115362.1 protein APEM9 [Humulus lupulus]
MGTVEAGEIGSLHSKIWEQIELSESYLVCSMYEEAASLASSTLNQLSTIATGHDGGDDDDQLYDMLESAGMVLVQSLNGLGRVSEILNELKKSFSSVAAIPLQVLLAGACFQISQSPSAVRNFLEEFLSKWRFVDDNYYVLASEETSVDYVKGSGGRFSLSVDDYLDVVEVYVMKILANTLSDLDLAIHWVEKAELPEDRRQELLRRLHSLHSAKATTSSRGSSALMADNSKKQRNLPNGSPQVLDNNYPLNDEKIRKQAVLRFSKGVTPYNWWYRSLNLKLGSIQIVVSNGKIAFGCLIVLIYWILRRKRASLKGIVQRQALNIKKAVVDLWQLAFSYQVNPLAAVQSPPAPFRGGQR